MTPRGLQRVDSQQPQIQLWRMILAGFQKLDRKVLILSINGYVLPMKYLWFPLAAES